MSISRAQAEALAEGFLDTIGSDDRSGLQPRGVYSELILIAGEMVEAMQDNLNQSANNASGKLSESIYVTEPVINGTVFSLDVMMNFYGKFQNKGVKGTRSGQSFAGYQFKNEFPSLKMVKAIQEWIRLGKISTRTVKKYKGYGKHETKNKSIAQIQSAYAVARSIKMHGIEPTGFLDKAILSTQQKVQERLGLALEADIIDSIT